MTPDERREFEDRREQNLILHGLLYFMKQQLVESSGTNVFLLHMHNQRGSNVVGTATTQQLWLFGQWHRQYILYDLKHYISDADPSGLRSADIARQCGTRAAADLQLAGRPFVRVSRGYGNMDECDSQCGYG